MSNEKPDFSWITEGIKAIDEYNTLKSKKGQELYNRAWLKDSVMPKTVAGWDELFEEINEFMKDPTNPEEDKDKIADILEGAHLMRSACKGMEEKAGKK